MSKAIAIASGLICGLLAVSGAARGERINHAGRILGPAPTVTNAVLFNTAEADAILSALQIFPTTNAWNEDISRLPLLPNSDAMIAQISADLSSSRRTLRAFQEMNFVLVPDSQAPEPIDFLLYGDESDPSPYPIPPNMPIETWPAGTGSLSLSDWQQDINNTGGDRHAIILQPGNGLIWEMWQAKRVGSNWEASNGARFDLKSNSLRPAGWTSADAAGLPMFPALPRFDECERGIIEHACRIVVARSRREYIYPATHFASTTAASQTNVPAMGQRLRLKSAFVIPSAWTKQERAILQGLKKYGAIVADNGGFFSISVTPDDRWPEGAFDHLSTIGITNFEVVKTTGPNEGPRSPGAPRAEAGPDRTVEVGTVVPLEGWVSYTGSPPSTRWALYSGPGTAGFAAAAQTNTTVTFSVPGVYTLMLSAADGVHATAYDAVVFTAIDAVRLTIARIGSQVSLAWTGGSPPYTIERAETIPATSWDPLLTTNGINARLPVIAAHGFFRVRAQ